VDVNVLKQIAEIVKNREMKFIKKDGSVITCLYSSILINLGGEPKVFTIIKDITDRKEMEIKLAASEEKFRVAFNTSPDAMNLNRASDGKYAEINEGFTKLTGYSRDEVMIVENFEKIIWASENDRIKLIKKLKENGFVDNFEANFVVKDGTIRTGLMSAKVILLNGEKYMLAATRDITERKIMEEKIINTSEKLKKAVDYLEKANAELERFTYVASHDMQEPLRMVSNYAQLLERKYKGKIDSDADDYIGYMVSGATRMSLLIKDLLVFSRIGKNGQDMEEVNVNGLIKEIIATIQLKLESTNAALNIGEMPVLKCDKSQIFQVFQNLLTNALKFVKKGQRPEIAITAELK
ncbi:MAG TPA: PAS domain S-box protein, partial [Candidatus Goldiibacteriota bacterium]|nr:PAS domain S-box protein [Candidatus Goldiibacteriota bacterium]